MIGLAVLLAAAFAQAGPPEYLDPRIVEVPYSANQVFSLSVSPGYAAVVALGPEERAESVVVGNSAEWQVTASRRGDNIVVKPLSGASPTNMVVITGERRYVFLLQPGGGDQTPFVMRFVYPEPIPASVEADTPLTTFRFKGSKQLFPTAMSDDGVRTTIVWARETPLPAVFAHGRDGKEALVNGRMVDGAYVVEQVVPRFTFRSGKASAQATRQARRNGGR